MGDVKTIETISEQEHQTPLTNTLTSYPMMLSREGLQSFDVCGLMSKFDTDSEDESVTDSANKLIKNEINISRTLGLKKRIKNEDIRQKFANLENEHKKIHTQIKSLQNNIVKKDKTLSDLSTENVKLNKKYEALVSDINEKNSNLLEYASVNLNLEKQLEKKNAEVHQLHLKCEKAEQVQTNLIKDIEYYKGELAQFREQKEQLKDFEELRRKYNETKRDNVKLGKKFRELKSTDAEHQQKAMSYNVLQKKFEVLQADMVKFRMENKRLKSKHYTVEQEFLLRQKVHESLKTVEKENAVLKGTIVNCESVAAELREELQNQRKEKEHLQKEIKIKDDIIKELKEKMCTTSTALDGLKNNCESTERYAELLSEQITTYKLKCETLESELAKLRENRNDSSVEVQTLKEEVKKLKIRLAELLIERSQSELKPNLQTQTVQTEKCEDNCANCHFLRQEVEKLGYANLRLHKEKLSLKANFQKLSVKTSKLEIKMEELSADKKLSSSASAVERKYPKEIVQRDVLIQQNLLLSKKLKDVVGNYDKLLKEYISVQQDKIPTTYVESSTIIQELQNHISNSQYAINTIEHKLNEEEGKLHASLYHLRTVKNKLSERKMALK